MSRNTPRTDCHFLEDQTANRMRARTALDYKPCFPQPEGLARHPRRPETKQIQNLTSAQMLRLNCMQYQNKRYQEVFI